jgi:chitobiase/beta-hexosaminidase-like protein
MKRMAPLIAFLFLSLLAGCGAEWFPGPVTPDTTPDQFAFSPASICATPGQQALIQSSAVTISGINQQVPVTVSGGEYSINGGSTWTTTAGNAGNGTTIIVRPTGGTVNTANTTVPIILSVGTVSATFTVNTGTSCSTSSTDTTSPTVTATPPGSVLAFGTYSAATLPISISFSANEAAIIFYTTNNSDPTASSSSFTITAANGTAGPLDITLSGTIVKFFGRDSAGNSSLLQIITYKQKGL